MIDFIDLFAGLGGIRIGFTQAANELGLESRCVFTSEIKDSALCALNHNFPGENIINPNRSLGPTNLVDIKVFSCSPESKECLSLVHRSYKT